MLENALVEPAIVHDRWTRVGGGPSGPCVRDGRHAHDRVRSHLSLSPRQVVEV